MQEVLSDDLLGIGGLHKAVPDGIRVNDQDGAVLALVETSGLIHANAVLLQAGGFHGIFQGRSQLLAVLFSAGRARGRLVALVVADKQVVLVIGHPGLDVRTAVPASGDAPENLRK
jgi:hypothetical protein